VVTRNNAPHYRTNGLLSVYIGRTNRLSGLWTRVGVRGPIVRCIIKCNPVLVILWLLICTACSDTVMGIQGLLPFLKKASRQSNIKEFKGCTVAIDSYCWLHRGAFACAEKLALGEQTDQLVHSYLSVSVCI